MHTVGDRIKELRTLLGLNQTEFATRINKKQTTIAGYENNTKQVIDRTVADICRVFKVEYLWLTTGEGEMFANQTDDDILAQIDVIMCGESTIHKNMIKSLVSLSEEQLLAIDAAIDKYIALKDGEK